MGPGRPPVRGVRRRGRGTGCGAGARRRRRQRHRDRQPDPLRADAAAALAPGLARVGVPDDAAGADLVVNATPVGMGGDAEVAVPADQLGPGQLVVDMVYDPALTPLLVAARDRGAVAVNGLGMLIHQAAHQFRAWTGEDPPVEVMSGAALAELVRRSR